MLNQPHLPLNEQRPDTDEHSMNILSGRYFSSNGQGGIWTVVRECPTSDLQQCGLHLSNKNAAP